MFSTFINTYQYSQSWLAVQNISSRVFLFNNRFFPILNGVFTLAN